MAFPHAQLVDNTLPPLLQQDLISSSKKYYSNRKIGFVHGIAPVVNNVMVDLWEGPTTTYVFPDAPQQMKIVSTSAEDSSSGTGARTVFIHYLDNTYTEKFETIILNGLTPVNTVATNILRINGMHSASVGSHGLPVGNISLTNIAGTVTYGFIGSNLNIARQAIYTVPAGHTGYINHWQCSSGSTGNHFCQIRLRATTHEGVLYPGVFLVQDEMGTQNNGNAINIPIPLAIPAMTDVKISAISDASNANVIALGAIMGWLEK